MQFITPFELEVDDSSQKIATTTGDSLNHEKKSITLCILSENFNYKTDVQYTNIY